MGQPIKLTDAEVAEKLSSLAEWKLLENSQIGRTYSFAGNGDFHTAIAFVNQAANLADAMEHHPDIDIRYSRVTCFLSTHDAGGLTELDFKMARLLDDAFNSLVQECT